MSEFQVNPFAPPASQNEVRRPVGFVVGLILVCISGLLGGWAYHSLKLLHLDDVNVYRAAIVLGASLFVAAVGIAITMFTAIRNSRQRG